MSTRRSSARKPWGVSRWLSTVVGLALLAVPTWWLSAAIRIAKVPSESMEPTLLPGDVLAVRIDAYRAVVPQRGDIVIFREAQTGEWIVKRVVAEPGEEIVVASGHVLLQSGVLDEPYIREPKIRERPLVVQVGQDEVFVMGDNRDHANDSRDFGPVKLNRLVGRVSAIILPWSRRSTVARFVDAVPGGGGATPSAP